MVVNKDLSDLAVRINRLAGNAELDFAGIVTGDGVPLYRLSPRSTGCYGTTFFKIESQ
ncbi:MAG: hypothetical protein KKD21_09460 [Proteobacteria bacterium]|nr:hypothetical protein [Pseudomonadota bacterium]MBU1697251.1 hypothetical protein [Pseudomonadota bacterium]